jgi:hypothetical protein
MVGQVSDENECNMVGQVSDENNGDIVVQVSDENEGKEDKLQPKYLEVATREHQAQDDVDPLDWIAEHLDELIYRYPDMWIAVYQGEVVASARDPAVLKAQIDASGIERPLITEIPSEPIVWDTAYAIF